MTYLGTLRSDEEPTLELPVVPRPEVRIVTPSGFGLLEVLDRLGSIVARLLLCLVPVLVCATVLLVVLGVVPWTAIHDALGELREHDGDAALASSPSRGVENGQEEHAPESEVPPPPTAPSSENEPAATAPPIAALTPGHPNTPSPTKDPEGHPDNGRAHTGSSPSVRTVAETHDDRGPVTDRDVGELRLGMTIAEVTAVIGVEGWNHWPGFHYGPIKPTDPDHQRSVAADPSRWEIRIWPQQYFGPVPVEVIFRDGRAVEINR